MKMTGLRIGNFISYRKEKILEVSSLGNNGFSTCNINGITYGSDDIEEYEPIPLTPAVFESGFTKIADTIFSFSGLTFFIGYSRTGVYCGNNFLRFITSVHELQNIIFFLTGHEIIIDELQRI